MEVPPVGLPDVTALMQAQYRLTAGEPLLAERYAIICGMPRYLTALAGPR